MQDPKSLRRAAYARGRRRGNKELKTGASLARHPSGYDPHEVDTDIFHSKRLARPRDPLRDPTPREIVSPPAGADVVQLECWPSDATCGYYYPKKRIPCLRLRLDGELFTIVKYMPRYPLEDMRYVHHFDAITRWFAEFARSTRQRVRVSFMRRWRACPWAEVQAALEARYRDEDAGEGRRRRRGRGRRRRAPVSPSDTVAPSDAEEPEAEPEPELRGVERAKHVRWLRSRTSGSNKDTVWARVGRRGAQRAAFLGGSAISGKRFVAADGGDAVVLPPCAPSPSPRPGPSPGPKEPMPESEPVAEPEPEPSQPVVEPEPEPELPKPETKTQTNTQTNSNPKTTEAFYHYHRLPNGVQLGILRDFVGLRERLVLSAVSRAWRARVEARTDWKALVADVDAATPRRKRSQAVYKRVVVAHYLLRCSAPRVMSTVPRDCHSKGVRGVFLQTPTRGFVLHGDAFVALRLNEEGEVRERRLALNTRLRPTRGMGRSLAGHRERGLVATGGSHGVKLWRASEARERAVFAPDRWMCETVFVGRSAIAARDLRGCVRVFDIATGQLTATPVASGATKLAALGRDNDLAVIRGDGDVVMLDGRVKPAPRNVSAAVRLHGVRGGPIVTCASDDGVCTLSLLRFGLYNELQYGRYLPAEPTALAAGFGHVLVGTARGIVQDFDARALNAPCRWLQVPEGGRVTGIAMDDARVAVVTSRCVAVSAWARKGVFNSIARAWCAYSRYGAISMCGNSVLAGGALLRW